MALPTGLVPVLVFVVTVGLAGPVALAAHLLHRAGTRPFAAALRVAGIEAALLYLVGVAAVWVIAGGWPLWEVAAALVATGAAALLLLGALPLLVGRWLVRRSTGADPDLALRYATYGWPVAALLVFGGFVAPGGVAGGDLLDLGGPRGCVAGFCGIGVAFAAGVVLEALVATVGPGVVGSLLLARRLPAEGERDVRSR